eukprot:CAMPEP_0175721656 /NCGR_PEP_ID=MMETSP0097-20121207/45822_1 /TAXON_ID=311494 /ORGANISM="Alexandrium monilatum, Strain CCMP3105" /LENGTH=386 /DNA_ID=CAMNT_0017029337 /DNA_START=17 /DNA_END=1174 /DNA_ORIENTATION=+
MAFVSPPRIPVAESLRTAIGPASIAGSGLCVLATAGLTRLALRALLTLPTEFFMYVAAFILGATLVFAEVLTHLWRHGVLQWLLAQSFLWHMRLSQRIFLVMSMPSISTKDCRAIFFEVLPSCIMAGMDATGVRDAVERVRSAKMLAGDSMPTEHTKAALEWLKRPQLALGYEEQLHLYGLAQQASRGDCPPAASEVGALPAGPVEVEQRQSWEARRGLPRQEAAKQLVRTLAAVDPDFWNANPALVSALPPPPLPQANQELPGAEVVRLVCGMVEARLPEDLDERLHRGKRWLLVSALCLAGLAGGYRRLRQSPRWRLVLLVAGRRLRQFAMASACTYLVAITYGLPPAVYARLPRGLRLLPHVLAEAAEETVGGPAPRLCRRAA